VKKNLDVNYSDSRGEIRDIFVSSPKDHCSLITFTLGAIRANHFHKESTQYTYVVNGELLMSSCLVDDTGTPIAEIQEEVLVVGDIVSHPPYHAHAFRALKPSTILAFADGIRGGCDYEKDVFRLKNSII